MAEGRKYGGREGKEMLKKVLGKEKKKIVPLQLRAACLGKKVRGDTEEGGEN